MKTKIENTTYIDNKLGTLVKLVLVKSDSPYISPGDIVNNEGKELTVSQVETNIEEHPNDHKILPILISESEPIKIRDILYDTQTDSYFRWMRSKIKSYSTDRYKKVVAIQSYFSDNDIESIITGDYRNNQYLYIEVETDLSNIPEDAGTVWMGYIEYNVKLDSDKKINIIKEKPDLVFASYEYADKLRSDVEYEDLNSEFIAMIFQQGAKWMRENRDI